MKARRTPWHLLPGLALLGLGAAAAAQEDEIGVIETLRVVDVRDVLPESLRHAPGAAAMLTELQLQALRPFTLTEALDHLAGVRTLHDDGLNRRANIGIRGAAPRRCRKVLMLEDGTPISAATYLDPDCHYTPPMDRLERIDVLKGAGQIIHGPMNNHGIVNFRNRRPSQEPETTFRAALGNHGAFQRHAMHSNTQGNRGYVLAYSGAQAEGVFDVEKSRYDDLHGSVHWAPAGEHELVAALTYFRERSVHDERNLSVEEFEQNPRGKLRLNEGAVFNNFSIDYFLGQLTHNYDATPQVRVSSKIFATQLDRPRLESRGGGPGNPGGYMVGRLRDYRTFGLESRASYSGIEGLGARHTLHVGIRGERQLFNDRRSAGQVGEALHRGNPGNRLALRDDGYPADGRDTRLQASAATVYIQDMIAMGDWLVTPGVRFEYFSQQRQRRFPAVQALERDINRPLLPGLSLYYDGLPETRIFAGVHRGYTPAIARNEDFPLVPETGVNTQLGLRTTYIEGLEFEASVFHNRLRDTLVRRTVTDEFGDNIFVNLGSSRSQGLDLSLRFDSNGLFNGLPVNLFSMLTYNYSDSRFSGGPLDGYRVPLVSLHSGSLTLGMEHAAGLQLSATLTHLGAFYTDEENIRPYTPSDDFEIVGGRVPGAALVSARASYALPNLGITLWLQGRNLTDRLFVTDVNDGLRPGPRRMFLLGAQLEI